ncbi:MAG: hypothetical protein J1E60_00870 [Christensenellaceae bacterium]|nr:hypothetical protein [Christensenellaceae bacterium]
MIVLVVATVCVIYDVMYMIHSIRGRRFGSVIGMVILIGLIAAGTAALQINQMK